MRKELIGLREKMKAMGITACMIPTMDFHGSEYINDYFKGRKFLSGFTGSAGTIIVTEKEAKLWTDGRYFLQGAAQLSGSGIDLMKMGEEGVPTELEYLENTLKNGDCLNFDGRVIDCAFGKEMEEKLAKKGVRLDFQGDILDGLWVDRPALVGSKIYQLPLSVVGKTAEEKLADLRGAMKAAGAKYHLMTKLEEIAWLFNLRGDDVANTPVFFAYALIDDVDARLYIMDEEFPRDWKKELVLIKNYFQIDEDLGTLDTKESILLDETIASYGLVKAIPDGMKIINGKNPCERMKAIKNSVEIENTINAHIKDGVAMCNFLYWIKNNIGKIPMTEISASDYLENCRKAQGGLNDLSFPTIAGYGPHGAIVHYSATPETDEALKPEGFLLVDSGAQFDNGTTDITRTIALGPLSKKMKEYYTAVLKSNIMLATYRFTPGTWGSEIDKVVRKPVQDLGLDYNHGTGHGVGHLLSVHEDPNGFSPRYGLAPIEVDMITTDEPGVYIEGEFGIRLENELLCKASKDGKNEFHSITLCPFDPEAIIVENLSKSDLDYLNDYHQEVYDILSPHLSQDVKEWLGKQTKKLG